MNWVRYQLTLEQAAVLQKIIESENWPPERIVRFQLFQNRFIINPFYYEECLHKVFGCEHLNLMFDKVDRTYMISQYLETHQPPTIEEIKQLLGDKAYLIGL